MEQQRVDDRMLFLVVADDDLLVLDVGMLLAGAGRDEPQGIAL